MCRNAGEVAAVGALALALLAVPDPTSIRRANAPIDATAGPATPAPARAFDDRSELVRLDLVGQFGGAFVNAMWADERLAYIGYGARLVVFDVSDLAHPVELGRSEVLSAVPTSLAAVGHTVYASTARGLLAINVSDPSTPREFGAVELPGAPTAMAIAGGVAYVAAETGGLHVIELVEGGSPRHAATLLRASGAREVATTSRDVFVIDMEGQLHIFRAADAGAPVEIASGVFAEYRGYYRYYLVAADRDRAYAIGVGDTPGLLTVLSVSDAGNVNTLGTFAVWPQTGAYSNMEGPRGIMVADGYLYLLDEAVGLQVVDVRDPADMVRVASHPIVPGDADLRPISAGTRLYLPNSNGASVLDTSRVGDGVREVHTWREDGFGHTLDPFHGKLAYRPPYVFLATLQVRALDLTVPRQPARSTWPVDPAGCGALLIAVEQDLAYVLDVCMRLTVLDVSDPVQPRELGSVLAGLGAGQEPTGMQVANGIVYLGGCPMVLVDARDPSHPRVVPPVPPVPLVDSCANSWRLESGRLYVHDERVGLAVYDLTDPTAPREVGTMALDTFANDIDASGGLVYLVDDQAIRVVDARDPREMRVAGTYPLGGRAIRQHEDRVYVLDDMRLIVLDASLPASMEVLAETVVLDAYPHEIAIEDGIAVALFEYGLHVLDVTSPRGGPRLAGSFTAGPASYTSGAALHGDVLCAIESGALATYDVAQRFAPRPLARLELPGPTMREVIVEDDTAFSTGYDWPSGRLDIVGLHSDADPVLLASHPVSRAIEVFVRDDVAYVCATGAQSGDYSFSAAYELSIVDVHDPRSPVTVGRLSRPNGEGNYTSEGCSVAVHEGVAYVHYSDVRRQYPTGPPDLLTAEARIDVVDVVDPSMPSVIDTLDVGRLPSPGYWYWHWHLRHLAIDGESLFVATSAGVTIYDVRVPAAPAPVGATALAEPVHAVRVHDGRAYALSEEGIAVLDVGDPSQPRLIGYARSPSTGEDVTVAGDAVYVAAGSAGHYVFRAEGNPIRSMLALPRVSR